MGYCEPTIQLTVFCILTENHLKNWDTEADSKVNQNIAPLLSVGFRHRIDRHDIVQTSVNTMGCRRDGYR